MPQRLIATAIALIAFTAAVFGGVAAGNPSLTIITRALVAFVATYAIGLLIGAAAQRAVREHIEMHKRAHPLEATPPAAEDAPAAPPRTENTPHDAAASRGSTQTQTAQRSAAA